MARKPIKKAQQRLTHSTAPVDWNAEAQRILETFGDGTRQKGEYVPPMSSFRLAATLGPKRAAKHLGISVTQLHRARTVGGISKVVEIAAGAVLSSLGAGATPQRAPEPQPFTQLAPRKRMTDSDRVMFLVTVDRSKASAFEKFARAMDAEVVSA